MKPQHGKKHVLITGGAGFVGSHLCDLFLKRGYAVTAVDNYVTGRRENVREALEHPDFDLIEHDVSLALASSRVPFIAKYGLHGVLHFACPASPVDFDRLPFEILAVDSLGTAHTVDLALEFGARYLVASTSEIYGDPEVHPQREDYWGNVNTIGPRACYDEAKRFAEAYVSTAARGVGSRSGKPYSALNAAIVRIFNTYGPRMRLDDGRIVPALCAQALQGQALTVHGNGLQTRSFCYVADLVDGIFKLFESDVPASMPTNIGNPTEYTVLQFAEALKKLSGKDLPITHQPARPDDPRRRCPDITRARTRLGWEPQVPLTDGLKMTLEFFRSELQR